jgi:hypothetical protein
MVSSSDEEADSTPAGLFGGISSDQTAARALVPHLSGAFLSVTASAGGVRIAQERGGEGASANGAAAAAG